MAETKGSIESLLNAPVMSPAATARVSLVLSHSRLLILLAAAAAPKAQGIPVSVPCPTPVSQSHSCSELSYKERDEHCFNSSADLATAMSRRLNKKPQQKVANSVSKGGRGESPESLSERRGHRYRSSTKHKPAGARPMQRSRAKGGHPLHGCALETIHAICAYFDEQGEHWISRDHIQATEYSQARAFLLANFKEQPNAFERTYEAVWNRPFKQHL